MQMRQVAAVRCPNGRDLLAASHIFPWPDEHRVEVRVIGLHKFPDAVFFVGVEHDDHIAPPRSGLARQQDTTVRDGVNRIAQIAVFAANSIQVVAEMAIVGERLRIISQCAVFGSEREIESCRRGQGRQFHRGHHLEGQWDSGRATKFRSEPKKKGHGHRDNEQRQKPWHGAVRSSSLARSWLHLYARAMRILVTGGAGFIGSHLVEKLLATGHEVSILDDFNDFYDPQIKRANIVSVTGDVAVHQIDLRDSAAVKSLFHREKYDAIVHLAARAGVRPSITQPQLYYDTNVNGTLHLLEAARMTGAERFIFGSSSSVYGSSKTVPFSEDLRLTQTLSPYAATKIAGEFLCSTYSHLYQMRVVALRFFTVYGARQRPDLAIHQFTRRIQAGEPIDQFGDGTHPS